MTEKMNLEQLNEVAGGNDGMNRNDSIHNLANFELRTVCNVIHYDASACLTLRRSPNGEQIPNVGWQNGERILIHRSYREDGWFFAFDRKSGLYGYVNPNNIA